MNFDESLFFYFFFRKIAKLVMVFDSSKTQLFEAVVRYGVHFHTNQKGPISELSNDKKPMKFAG